MSRRTAWAPHAPQPLERDTPARDAAAPDERPTPARDAAAPDERPTSARDAAAPDERPTSARDAAAPPERPASSREAPAPAERSASVRAIGAPAGEGAPGGVAPVGRAIALAVREPAHARSAARWPGGLRAPVPWWALAGVLGLAAALRLVGLGGSTPDPFYDAAVRSMGQSFHAFWVGAFDPLGQVAIDKPPVDLWLQVAATRLLGFSVSSLLLPVALGGILAVVGLFDLVRTLAGPRAGLAAALALSVLPIAVLTARSDTMDAVMAALLVLAFAVAARGLRRGRTGAILLAGALVGLAFEVKLFEALEAAPALAAMWWWGAAASPRRRAAALGGAAALAMVVGLGWLTAMTLTVPAGQRPFAFGSHHGSAWGSALVYDGWDRLTGRATPPATPPAGPVTRAAQIASIPAPAGPTRLLSGRVELGVRFGIAALLALLVAAAVLVTRAWRPLDRAGRAGAGAIAGWALLGTLLATAQSGLRPRYLEAVDPAVAATLGGGLVLLALAAVRRGERAAAGPARRGARSSRRAALPIIVLGAVLALGGLGVSVGAVATHAEDSGAPGALPPARVVALSRALRAWQGTARFEVASLSVAKAGPLIVRDGRPVLLLTAAGGRPLVSVPQLAALVRSGAVRSALLGSPCPPGGSRRLIGCSPLAAWVRAHGVDASRAAGQPHAGLVFRFAPAPAGPAGPPAPVLELGRLRIGGLTGPLGVLTVPGVTSRAHRHRRAAARRHEAARHHRRRAAATADRRRPPGHRRRRNRAAG